MAKIMLYTTEPKSFVQEELEKYAKQGDHEFEVVNPMECAVLQSESGNKFMVKGKPIGKFDYCIPRMSEDELDYKVISMKYFEDTGVKVLNTGAAMAKASNKVDMQIALNAAGIKTPKSILLNDKDFLDQATTWLDEKFPMIVKTVYGTHGVGVIKADSLGSLRSIIQQLIKNKEAFMIQEFLEHDKAYRVLILDGKVLGAVARTTAPNDFRTNAHQGSDVSAHQPSEKEVEIGSKAAKAVGLNLAAVDYIIQGEGDSQEVIVLEVNGSPGFESMQEVVEEPIAEKIINYIITGLSTADVAPEEEEEVGEVVEPAKEAEEEGPPEEKSSDEKVIEPEVEKIKADDFAIIGTVDSVVVKYFNDEKSIKARIDTGAEYSSIHGSDIQITDETISFVFGDFRYRFSLLKNVNIVAANGKDKRPIIRMDIVINGTVLHNVEFTVADRDDLNYDVLLGRRALAQANMLVNPSVVYQGNDEEDVKLQDDKKAKAEEE